MIFRDYKAEDFFALIQLWEALGLGNAKRGDDDIVIQQTLKNDAKLIIMEADEGQIMGSAWLTNDGRRIYLHHFGIHKDWQGKGYAKKLMKECLQFAKQKKMQIKLEVHKDNITAIELYKAGGFKYLGDYLVFIIREI